MRFVIEVGDEMNFLYLFIGFVLLIKGADWLVDSAAKLAKSFGVSSLIIGLSVVAFGTSAPEATVGIFSGIKHTNAITLGDVVGSSITNIALIIGISAVLLPLTVDKSVLKKEIPMSFAIQVIFLGMAVTGSILSRLDGIILLILFLIFLVYLWKSARNPSNEKPEGDVIIEEGQEGTNGSIDIKYKLKLVLLLIIGLACLVFGGNLVVDSSVGIAHAFGLSEALIGVTIVALGTSLPELVTCVVAAYRKESDIAVGNIIGSNIFNILFVIGLSSTISSIKVSNEIYLDIAAMLLSTILLFLLAFFGRRLSRISGLALVCFYSLFIIYKIITI